MSIHAFSLTDKLILTVDPFFEYTKANGGGTVTATEAKNAASGLTGFIGGTPYVGHDLNGDGDTLDKVTLLAPSNTITHRYGVIANLRYDFTPDQSIRVNYTLDYGKHRQTGEADAVSATGQAIDVFPDQHPDPRFGGATSSKSATVYPTPSSTRYRRSIAANSSTTS